MSAPPRTLLIPALFDAHWPLLRWAFESPDRHAVVLDGDRGVETLGLRHVHNDLCYPFVLITGQVLAALQSGQYDPSRTAVLISQAGDACRGSCLIRLLRPVLDWFYTLPIKPVRKFAQWLERRSARKREKMHSDRKGVMGWLANHVSAETLELIGLYVFVALPLPGTGAWTGSAIATLFEMPRGKSFLAILLGNFTACLITTLATPGVVNLIH